MADQGERRVLLARLLAQELHEGQVRLDGEPYFEHCERVARAVAGAGADAQVVGYLHDVVEDTRATADTLAVLFGPDVAVDVLTVSRIPGQEYHDFIARVASEGSDVALAVKIADLEDNLPGAPPSLQAKYLAAKAVLGAEARARRAARATSSR